MTEVAVAGKPEALTKPGAGEIVRCTFCGTPADAAFKLFASSNALICDACVDLCADILEEVGPDVGTSRHIIRIKLNDAIDEFEAKHVPTIVPALQQAFPDFRIEVGGVARRRTTSIVLRVVLPEGCDLRRVEEGVQALTFQLLLEQKKHFAKKKNRDALDGKVAEHEKLLAEKYIKGVKARGLWPGRDAANLLDT